MKEDNEYSEDDYLLISGLQHFDFCKRQWALIHIEQIWEENYLTVDGELFHEHAHDEDFVEKRKDIIITRGLNVHSRSLGIIGKCDVVEFIHDKNGITLHNYEGTYRVEPIEYKRGTSKNNAADILQLVAQAMCLEEMLCCKIKIGYLYYGKTRHREKIDITDDLKEKVICNVKEMREYYNRRYTPIVKKKANCKSCSLYDYCLPTIFTNKSVAEYVDGVIKEIQ